MTWGAHKADVRVAAKNSVTMRAALRASINARNIYEAYQQTHPFVTDNITQDRTRARAWAMLHVRINNEPIAAALKKIYADGFLLGLDASAEAIGQAKTEYNKAAITKAKKKEESPDYVDWNNWKPGNRAAALLYRPTGAFEKLLNDAGITSKKIAANGFDRIGTALADSIAAGFSPARAAKVITEKIGDPARALTIAITEQNRAMSLAAMENYKNGGVEKVEWSGANPCDICAPNEGQVVNTGEAFNSGDTEPPVHPNCRCALLPVIDDAYFAEPDISGVDNIMPTNTTQESEPQKVVSEEDVIRVMNQQRNAGYIPTKTELEAISEYTSGSGHYGNVNDYLRTGVWDRYTSTKEKEKVQATITQLDSAIANAPKLQQNTLSYRGIWGQDAVQAFAKLKPGDTYTDNGYISTSLNLQIARNFARADKANPGVVLEIVNPAGTQGLFPLASRVEISPQYATPISENEWLLPRGTTFKVLEVNGTNVKVRVK